MEFLKGKKTYLIAGNMVLIAIIQLLVGDISLVDFVSSPHLNTLLQGLGLASLRAGVSKIN